MTAISAGGAIFLVLMYLFFTIKRAEWMRRQFKAIALTMIFAVAFLPEVFSIGGTTFNSKVLIAYVAGIEAVDAWCSYSHVKIKHRK